MHVGREQPYVFYVHALCCKYTKLVDYSVMAFLTRPGKEKVTNGKLSVLISWREAMMETKVGTNLGEWEAVGLKRYYFVIATSV